MRANWTEEETELFRQLYPVRTANQLSEVFPQYTWRQMHTKAGVLGIKKVKQVATQSRRENTIKNKTDLWTDEEKALLIEHYAERGGKYIHDLMGGKRSIATINRVANRMGIKRKQKNLVWEMIDVEVDPNKSTAVVIKYKGW